MFNNAGGYSLSDIAAATRDCCGNNGFGGDGGAWWIIFLFLFVFCGWGNNGNWGNGNAGLQGALTRADLCQDMSFGQLENGIRGISQGLCDGFYAQNTNLLNGFAGVQNALTNGFAGVDNAICTLGYQTQAGINTINVAGMQNTNAILQGINANTVANMQNTNAIQAQLAECCCENKAGQKDIEYRMATDTCALQNTIQNTTRDLIEVNNNNTKSILDFMINSRISKLEAENQRLHFAAEQNAQNAFIAANQSAQTAELIRRLGADCPMPAYVVQPPQPVTFPIDCCGTFTGNNNGRCNTCNF